jgi:peptidoglycan/LPS O-acetylase OafA/YrhL
MKLGTESLMTSLRLALAVTVVLSHTLEIAGYASWASLGGLVGLGDFGVAGFFALSGFLIANSASHRTPLYYWKLRISRIFPAYWLALTMTGIIFFIVQKSWTNIDCTFGPEGPLSYVLKNALLVVNQDGISCVHTRSEFQVVNGSLWTLAPEFACYLLAFVLFRLKSQLRQINLFSGIVGSLLLLTLEYHFVSTGAPSVLVTAAPLCASFLLGMAVYESNRFRKVINRYIWPITLAWTVSIYLGLWNPIGIFLTAILLVGLGNLKNAPQYLCIPRSHDVSYGVYLSHFPVLVLLKELTGDVSGLPLFGMIGLALIISVLYGYASWTLLERRMKNLVK